MSYDLTRLRQQGDEYEHLTGRLKQLRAEMQPEILEQYGLGAPQVELVKASHYTRETIRQLTLSDAERAAEEQRRGRTVRPKAA